MNLLDTIPEPLRPLYEEGFRKATETGEAWKLDFECSSSRMYRIFHMSVTPLGGTGGFLIVSSLAVESPQGKDRPPMPAAGSLYVGTEDIVTMCSHCRRTQIKDGSRTWDWVLYP